MGKYRKPFSISSASMVVRFYDEDHSEEEDRYIFLVRSNRGRVLVVIYTERGDRIRIISARKATPREEFLLCAPSMTFQSSSAGRSRSP